ncbi:hypothetical protein BvCmsH55A_01282 [Escherichia coli]|nr:hypothetical protein BvCmsH55A_01282 [Escherichia coli]
MVTNGCSVAHLEAERLIVCLHLLKGREDINFSIQACPVATNTNYFTDTFIIPQLIYFDPYVTWLYPIASGQT